jgi:hypothetical protein
MLSITEALAVFPDPSFAVPVIVWFAPSVVTVWAAGHVTGATPPLHVKVTVTFVLFQPAAFGGGLASAVIVSAAVPPCTVRVCELDAPTGVVTTTGPVWAPVGTVAMIRKLLHRLVVNFTPLSVTEPGELRKFSPTIPNLKPTFTVDGIKARIEGRKLKVTPLLLTPRQLTTTGPAPAKPSGAFTIILVLVQLTI